MTDEEREKIEVMRDWLATRTAWVDQMEKRFHAQYDGIHPMHNQLRMNDIEAWRFDIEIHRWEMEGFIASLEDDETFDEGEEDVDDA